MCENATLSKSDRFEATASLVTFLGERKVEWSHPPRGPGSVELENGTEFDSCGSCSSCMPEQFSYLHVGNGQFSLVPSHGFFEILDIAMLDLSNRAERDWAMSKIREEEPSR